jgi:hypothetical protein
MLQWLQHREEQLWTEVEGPARAALAEQALQADEKRLKRLAQYRREHERMLKSNLRLLLQECKRAGIVLPPGAPHEKPGRTLTPPVL